jgi:hypothetical protein
MFLSAIVCGLVLVLAAVPAGATTIRSGFDTNVLARNDDLSTGLVPIGYTVNFFGLNFSNLYVNNNGNVTFDSALGTYTPFNLTSTGRQIIAPFFADVDTGNLTSDEVTYGQWTVGSRPAFGANWDGVTGVGYYNQRVDRLNKFQLVMIDRSDIGAGDFDFEFNYDQIQWETGDASGGSGGLGGNSARAGFSNGTGNPGTAYELPGSAINGAFLDGGPNSLVAGSNIGVAGRYLFTVRNGIVEPVVIPEPLTLAGLVLGVGALGPYLRRRREA